MAMKRRGIERKYIKINYKLFCETKKVVNVSISNRVQLGLRERRRRRKSRRRKRKRR